MSVQVDNKFISLGSNLGDRLENIRSAISEISKFSKINKISNIYETPAHVKKEENMGYPFLNLVIEVNTNISATNFLAKTKEIECKIGRKQKNNWQPRLIDIDILTWGESVINTPQLQVPHPEMLNRSFVLAPLKDLNWETLDRYRALTSCHYSLMQIVNITPDSFSQSDKSIQLEEFKLDLEKYEKNHISYIDIGGESTRPNATPVSASEEWQRIVPYIDCYNDYFKEKLLKPKLSIDTYHPETMIKALKKGVHILNDVSGLTSEQTISTLKNHECEYVLMHSLDIPSKKNNTIKEPIIPYLKNWLENKLENLVQNNINLNRIIFDPGIGFGKTSEQSINILRNINEFKKFPVKVLIGHSRKSFLNKITDKEFKKRDFLTIGVSLALIGKKIDILRTHNSIAHSDSLRAYNYVNSISY